MEAGTHAFIPLRHPFPEPAPNSALPPPPTVPSQHSSECFPNGHTFPIVALLGSNLVLTSALKKKKKKSLPFKDFWDPTDLQGTMRGMFEQLQPCFTTAVASPPPPSMLLGNV